ncbi:MAG: elongation factor P [Nitrospirota bacterium]
MISTSEFRNGAKVEIDSEPYIIIEFQHVKPGKGGAFVRTKLKNLRTKKVIEKTFRSGEKFDTPNLEEKEMEYLYSSGDQYNFMDISNYEQFFITKDELESSVDFLKENMRIKCLFYKGKAISIELPIFVELKISQTDPGIKGDTASGGTKPATLETGAIIKVPFHINESDIIKIDTRTGEYVERVNK